MLSSTYFGGILVLCTGHVSEVGICHSVPEREVGGGGLLFLLLCFVNLFHLNTYQDLEMSARRRLLVHLSLLL